MENKIYVGSGKEFGKYGDVNIDICLSDLPAEWRKKSEKNGKIYIKLTVSKKKEADKYGNTHAVSVNTFVPDKKADTKPKTEAKSDDLPF
jgi:hypothetical protein